MIEWKFDTDKKKSKNIEQFIIKTKNKVYVEREIEKII